MTTAVQQKGGHPFEYKPVITHQILVDPLYQRELNQKKVDKIISEFNYDLVNEPKVSMRADGKLYVFNGQHTTAAWKIHEGADAPIMCKVFRGLTWEDEKNLFLAQNGISSDPTTFEKLRALFNAGDAEVRDMVQAAAEAGVMVTFQTRSDSFGRCRAYSSLVSMYKALSRTDYVDALKLITAAWQGQSDSYSAGFICGMTNLFKKYKGQFSFLEMRKSLERNTPKYYIREAKDMTGQLGTRYEKLFVREYNVRRRIRLGE